MQKEKLQIVSIFRFGHKKRGLFQCPPYMMYLDPDTRQWSNPAKLADLAASGLNLKFTSDGVGYVTFTNSNHLHTLRTE